MIGKIKEQLRSKLSLLRYLRFIPFDASTEQGRADERHRRIALSAFAGVVSQVVNYAVMIVMVPLLLRSLGKEQYGLWLAISAAASFAVFGDLGMGNGLVNLLGKAHWLDDRKLARTYVSSATAVLLTMALVTTAVGAALIANVDWAGFFQIQDPGTAALAGKAVGVYFVFFVLNVIFGVSTKIRMAYQEMYINNLLVALGKVLMLVGAVVGAWLQLSFLYFVAVLAGSQTITFILNGAALFGVSHKWIRPSVRFVEVAAFKELFRTGSFFFVSGVAGVLAVQIDSLVIGKYLGAAVVPIFAIPLQLFMISRRLLGFVMMPLWPAYREAIVRQDLAWVRKTFWRTIRLTFAVNTVPMLVLLFFTPQIIRVWTGETLTIPVSLLVALAINTLMTCLNGPLAMLLNGANVLGIRALFAVLSGVANLLLSIWLVTHIGVSGPVWGTVITQLLLSWSVSFYYANRVLNGKYMH